MLSGRMLKVMDYLQNKNKTTYKEIANDLDIKERYVRYDIDRINDLLKVKKMPTIEKLSKGCIIFPKYIDSSILTKDGDFIYSQEERASLILLILLTDKRRLKMNKLSLDFQVSRSTIKNDINFIAANLSKYDIKITYTDHFSLDGPNNKKVSLLNNELKKYIYLFKDENIEPNVFESYAVSIIERAFSGVVLKDVIKWIDNLLENMKCILTDDSYKWYVANIFGVILSVIEGEENPLESTIDSQYSNRYDYFIKSLEKIINMKIDYKKQKVIIRLLNYINKDTSLDGDFDLVYIETIVSKLIEAMWKEMEIDFSKDNILIDGLLSHIVLLIKRIRNNINISDKVFSVIPEKYMDVVDILSEVIKEIDELKDIRNYDEIAYLAIHFIASRKRLIKAINKNILLVCGHGYGSTNMLKETLLSKYQMIIIDTLPVYKLDSYNRWEKIDYIISTTKLNNLNNKKCIVVNPLLSDKDFMNIEKAGVERKNMIPDYHSINKKLDFLHHKDRIKVLEVIKMELGYQNVITPSKTNGITDLLSDNCIKIINEEIAWKEVVKEGTRLLEEQNFIDSGYEKDIISTMENVGFYSVANNCFALLHGKGGEGINCTCFSLIISKKPIKFGRKKAKIIFCLASKDKKEHIPAVVVLMRMIKNTNLIKKLENVNSLNEIKEILYESELEVAF
ncbi:PTS sugar transporter subunit IIA [Clostridium sp. YIM B02506]|uniref:BglG family transcription antiterminator n=1 Tax=Clostridium sp. YIM B02506 TaxID=2910680 RepID=UPI001EEEFF72